MKIKTESIVFLFLFIGIASAKFSSSELYTNCKNGTKIVCFGKTQQSSNVDCVGAENCDIVVAIFKDSKGENKDKIHFQFMGNHWGSEGEGGYIAVGISEDDKMGKDSVIECVHSASKGNHIFGSYNHREKGNTKAIRQEDDSYIMKNEIWSDEHGIFCDFHYNTKTTLEGHTFDLSVKDKQYHILLATGPVGGADGMQIEFHRPSSGNGKAMFASDRAILKKESIDESSSSSMTSVNYFTLIFGILTGAIVNKL